jgi:hypothetical protein
MPFEPDCELSTAKVAFFLPQCLGPHGTENASLLFVPNLKVSFTRLRDLKSMEGRIEEEQ